VLPLAAKQRAAYQRREARLARLDALKVRGAER
jgi:hypothetical protein